MSSILYYNSIVGTQVHVSGENVGIGTTSPAYKLDVNGTFSANSININDAFTFPTSDGSSNQVLQTDGSGTLSWTTLASSSNYYLDGITKSGNKLTFSVNGASDQDYTFGSNAFTSYTDHSIQGYLTSLGTALVDADFASAGIMATDGSGTYSIVTNNSANWNTAYGWGNHASVGYLTSLGTALVDADFATAGIMATDGSGTYSIITNNSANWNTAYSWGNHASVGYLTTHPSISAASSSDNSGRTYIQDITLDSNGHVIGLATATETVTDTDTNYYLTGITKSGNILTFTVSGAAVNPTYTFGSNAFTSYTDHSTQGYIDGTGTANSVPKWSDSDTLTDSSISDDGTDVNIDANVFVSGTLVLPSGSRTSPALKIDDNSGIYAYGFAGLDNGLRLFKSSGNGTSGMGTGSPDASMIADFDTSATIFYMHATSGNFTIREEAFRINSDGLVFNYQSGVNVMTSDIHVFGSGNGDDYFFRVDGNTERIGIGTANNTGDYGFKIAAGVDAYIYDGTIAYLSSTSGAFTHNLHVGAPWTTHYDEPIFRVDISDWYNNTLYDVYTIPAFPDAKNAIWAGRVTYYASVDDKEAEAARVGFFTETPEYDVDVSGMLHANDLFVVDSIRATGLSAGVDNTVAVINSSGYLVTDEIDGRVWGSSLVDGTGTANYLSKWSDSDTIINSIIYDDGTDVGIGTASPGYKLDVNGTFSANSINVNDAFTLPTSDGSPNQVLQTDGAGTVSWATVSGGSSGSGNYVNGSFDLTSSSGTFSVTGGYTVGTLNVYQNGIKLYNGDDYTATNGSDFSLTNTAASGDVIEYWALNSATSATGNTTFGSVTTTSSQTTFSTTGYTTGGLVVFVNGVKQVDGTDFTATNGSSFALTSAAASGDVVDYIAYGATVASTNLQKTGDTMTGNLTVSADLIITGYKETHTDNGNTGTSQTIDISDSTLQTYTLTGNCTFSMPAADAGRSFTMLLKTGAGSFTASFTNVKFPSNTAPTITTVANRMDIITFVSDGTNWYGNVTQEYHL